MIAHRETQSEWLSGRLGHRILSALLMALLLLLLYALVHAAAAAIIGVPGGYMSAGGLIVAVGCLLYALSAPTLRTAWMRLSFVGGVIALALGTLALAAASWSGDTAAPLPIEIPWSLQATWGSVIRATTVAIAIVSLGLTLLIVAYALHRNTSSEAAPMRRPHARKVPR
jgi:hypothetical protein